MTKHKRHDDKEFFRRVQNEFPELFEAELTIDLDDTFKALIASNPDKLRVTPRHRRRRRRKLKSQSYKNQNT